MRVGRGLGRASAAALAALVGFALGAAPAAAAPQTKTINLSFAGSTNPNVNFSVTGVCDICVPDILGPGPGSWGLGAQIATTVTSVIWSGSASTAVKYDDSFLRQGQTLNLSDTLATIPGTIKATGALTGSIGLFNDPTGGTNWQIFATLKVVNAPMSLTFACALPLPSDPPADCNSGVVAIPLASIKVIPGVPEIDANLSVHTMVDVSVTGGAVATVRSAQILGGGSTQTTPLTFVGSSPSTVADSVLLACTEPAGHDLQYGFTNTTYSPSVGMATTTALHVEAVLTNNPVPPFTDINLFGGDLASITTPPASLSLPLTASDQSADLGTLQPDLDPPVADPGGGSSHGYAGVEGAAIAFDGSASSDPHCGPPTLSWNFGDSGSGTGTNPSHPYTEEGIYHGVLTATNGAGLKSTAGFTVTVADAPLNATGFNLVAPNPFSGTVATFTDADATNTIADSNQDPSDYTATIDWGDGMTTAGTVVPNGVGFNIRGSHTYSAANLGPRTLTIKVTDVGGSTATATTTIMVFQFLDSGAFGIGDQEAGSGTAVTFWGARWTAANMLSTGPAPASFKGFESDPSTTPPNCGGTWTTGPGNSSEPPQSLPSYMGVVVSSSISKSGSTLAGDVTAVVVVKTNNGYRPNPGHRGTGTVVAMFCHV